jgi:hypothetical protein
MTRQLQLLLFSLTLLTLPTLGQAGPRVGISLGFNVAPPFYGPYYHRPYYPYGYHYRPYPIFVEPAPIIVHPAPVVVRQPTIIETAPPPVSSPIVQQVTANAPNDRTVEFFLRQLNQSDDNQRREAVLELGRMKADRAVEPLTALLSHDPSPTVRETAARALGLIASNRAMQPLIKAAQEDNDRDVRHSAQFSIEIIRANLRRN